MNKNSLHQREPFDAKDRAFSRAVERAKMEDNVRAEQQAIMNNLTVQGLQQDGKIVIHEGFILPQHTSGLNSGIKWIKSGDEIFFDQLEV